MDNESRPRLFSVGHSNHDLAHFLDLLGGAGVTAVADVRSAPFSRRLPQFNRPELERTLREHGIAYVFLGEELGGRPQRPDLYTDGVADYERMRRTSAFRSGLERLIQGTEDHAVAMLCSEADPLDCHRGLMITPALVECGLAPLHLLRDGKIETTAEMEERLLQETRPGQGILDGLFAAALPAQERAALLAEAYRQMGRRKAFRLPQAPGREIDPASDV
jgi:uncharacterized protein (DUF488 family)